MSDYTVRVTKDTLVFSAGHFITFENGESERLHGHNYRVAVEVAGPLNAAGYVVDFIALRDRSQELVAELDHRMLIPTGNPHFDIVQREDELHLRYKHKKYVFPREDCLILPIPNTTTEHLAAYLKDRLGAVMRLDSSKHTITVEVEENFGLSARVSGAA